MSEPEKPSLEELARRLRECAEKLSLSAQKLRMAASHQREHVQKLNELNERIKKTLAALRNTPPPKVAKDQTDNAAPEKPAPEIPDVPKSNRPDSSFQFIDLTQLLSNQDDDRSKNLGKEIPKQPPPQKFPREMTYVEALEFTDYNEFLRFQGHPPINSDDLQMCDIEELFRLLLDRDDT